MLQPACENCRYVVLVRDDVNDRTLHECHRTAPSPGLMTAQWPIVQPNDWCGDGKPRKPKKGAS